MSERRFMKAGDEITAKAMAKLRKQWPHVFGSLKTKEDITVQSKSETKHGQWVCGDCGSPMANNFEADSHALDRPRHRLVWWTGVRFEEP